MRYINIFLIIIILCIIVILTWGGLDPLAIYNDNANRGKDCMPPPESPPGKDWKTISCGTTEIQCLSDDNLCEDNSIEYCSNCSFTDNSM